MQYSRILETPTAPNSDKVVALIAALNTSCNTGSYEAHVQQQQQDPEIKQLIDLITLHGDSRSEQIALANKIQRMLYKEYDSLRLIDNILYREVE